MVYVRIFRLIREYLMWLEEGEDVHAQPHHADINRFLTEQVKNHIRLDILVNTKFFVIAVLRISMIMHSAIRDTDKKISFK